MEVYQSPLFKRQFKKLLELIQQAARNRVDIFIANPYDPGLKTHKLQGSLSRFCAFSVTRSMRIMFEWQNDDVPLLQIGDHDIYD